MEITECPSYYFTDGCCTNIVLMRHVSVLFLGILEGTLYLAKYTEMSTGAATPHIEQ